MDLRLGTTGKTVVMDCGSALRATRKRRESRIAAQQQPVAADLPALQPIEKAHAEEAGLELSGLRHQSIDTTAEYAKVDRIALSRLALPWPGSES